jgi:predicted nucleotidyltransferase component of viral defense system
MDILRTHEIFEIEVLDKLKNSRLLEPLVFGGGTMLRLCHELNRYSADLDFWFTRRIVRKTYFQSLRTFLEKEYELTDSEVKFNTILCEIRSNNYPKRLKIEIRRMAKECDFQERIAFSPYGTKQVILKVHTLEQSMKNKIAAAVDREEIRDCFDIEFLLRQGIPLTGTRARLKTLEKVIGKFREKHYKVTLGSTLESETRKYYVANNFSLLLSHLRRQGG